MRFRLTPVAGLLAAGCGGDVALGTLERDPGVSEPAAVPAVDASMPDASSVEELSGVCFDHCRSHADPAAYQELVAGICAYAPIVAGCPSCDQQLCQGDPNATVDSTCTFCLHGFWQDQSGLGLQLSLCQTQACIDAFNGCFIHC